MHAVLPAPIDTQYTPVGKSLILSRNKSDRVKYDLYKNETFSCEDRVSGILIKTESREESRELRDSKRIVERYRGMIEDHVERRVAVIFQQFVVAYCTHLHFEIGDTLHQAESSKTKYEIDHQNTKKVLSKCNAAHSSTLPNIIAYDGRTWSTYQNGQISKPQGFSYINGSDIYKAANSTLSMPISINQADIAIDGTGKPGDLRFKTITLLNECAKGFRDPKDSLKLFLSSARSITSNKVNLASKEEIKEVLKQYRVILDSIIGMLADEKFFERMLNIQVDGSQNNQVKKVVLNLRYKAITDNQYKQSEIILKIEKLKEDVLSSLNKPRKPDYFDTAVLSILRDSIRSNENKTALDKLLNNPQGHYFRQDAGRQQRLDSTIQTIRSSKQAMNLINSQSRDIELLFYGCRREEIFKRSSITQVLRHAMDLTQKALAEKIKNTFRYAAASQSTISRVENRVKIVDRVYASQLAAVFRVDPAIFMPSFFYGG